MPNNNNLKKLYDTVNADYELPDYATFEKDMGEEKNLKKLYETVNADYELPDYATFKNDMGFGQQTAQPQSQGQQQAAPKAQQPSVSLPSMKPTATPDVHINTSEQNALARKNATAIADALGVQQTEAEQPQRPQHWEFDPWKNVGMSEKPNLNGGGTQQPASNAARSAGAQRLYKFQWNERVAPNVPLQPMQMQHIDTPVYVGDPNIGKDGNAGGYYDSLTPERYNKLIDEASRIYVETANKTRTAQDYAQASQGYDTAVDKVVDYLSGEGLGNDFIQHMVKRIREPYANQSAIAQARQMAQQLPALPISWTASDEDSHDVAQMRQQALQSWWDSSKTQYAIAQQCAAIDMAEDDYIDRFLKPALNAAVKDKWGANWDGVVGGLSSNNNPADLREREVSDQLVGNILGKDIEEIMHKYEREAEEMEGSKWLDYVSGVGAIGLIPHIIKKAADKRANEHLDPQKITRETYLDLYGKLNKDPRFKEFVEERARLTGMASGYDYIRRFIEPMFGGIVTGTDNTPAQNGVVQQHVDELTMERMKPQGTMDYVLGTGYKNSIIGQVERKLTQTDYENWLEDQAVQRYDANMVERVLSGGTTFIADWWSYMLPGQGGKLVTNGMLKEAGANLAADLAAHGMEHAVAERYARQLVTKGFWQRMQQGAVSGAITFGGHDFGAALWNGIYTNGQNGQQNTFLGTLGEALGEGAVGIGVGGLMFGSAIGESIGGASRGLARNIAGDVVAKGFDAAVMSGQGFIEQAASDPNFELTGKGVAESFLESFLNLTILGGHHLVGKYAGFRNRKNALRGQWTDTDEANMREGGYGELYDALFEFAPKDGYGSTDVRTHVDNYAPAYAMFLADGRVPETTKAKVMALVEGRTPSSLSPVMDYKTEQGEDGKYTLTTYNADGGIIDRQTFKTEAEAAKAGDALQFEMQVNHTIGLESELAKTMGEANMRQLVEDTYKKVSEDPTRYLKGTSLANLTEEEQAALRIGYFSGVVKDQRTRSMLEGVMRVGEGGNGAAPAYSPEDVRTLANATRPQMDEVVRSFEEVNNLGEGYVQRALQGHATYEEAREHAAEGEEVLSVGNRYRTQTEQNVVQAYNTYLLGERLIRTAYERGHAVTDPAERKAIFQEAADKRAAAAEALGVNADEVDAYADRLRGSASVQEVDVYVEARERARGVLDAIEGEVEEQVQEYVKNRTHKDGYQQKATLKEKDADGNDMVVYVLDGDVVPTEDGTMIDTGKSSGSVLVFNPVTGKTEMVSPKDLLRTDAREAAPDAEALREEYEKQVLQPLQPTVREASAQPGENTQQPTVEQPQTAQPQPAQQPTVEQPQPAAQPTAAQPQGEVRLPVFDYEPETDDFIMVRNDEGNVVEASIDPAVDSNGNVWLTLTNGTIGGKRMAALSRDEFAERYVPPVSERETAVEAPAGNADAAQQTVTPQTEGVKFSNELDENGHQFVLAADGTTVFGKVRDESGLPAAPIKLSEGFQDADGKGYGLAHIEANHGEQIRNAGFASVEDFVSFVAQNYDENNIRVGKRRENGSITYLLQVTDKHDNTLFVELSHDGSYWNVNSAGIFRKGYSNKKETVAKTEPQQPNNAVSTGSSLSSDVEEDGNASSEPNGKPTVSAGKDTANPSNVQENGAENSSALSKIPVGDKGSPVFTAVDAATGWDGLVEYMEDEGDALEYAQGMVDATQKALAKVQKQKPKASTDPAAFREAKKAQREAVAKAQQEADAWKAIVDEKVHRDIEEQSRRNQADEERRKKAKAEAQAAEEAAIQETVNTGGKFTQAPKIEGLKASRTLADGTVLKGTYMIVPAESLTPSHDATNGYRKSEGFPVNADGRTVNDRDYEADKKAQATTDDIANHYDGQAVDNVPTVSDEGIVYDGNGRTMAGQKAAAEGKDAAYMEYLKDNAQKYGVTREQIEQSGMEHPRVVFVTDERLPYTTEVFAKFNAQEKKTQGNAEKAVAMSKKLSAEDINAVMDEIAGSVEKDKYGNPKGDGTIDSLFGNPNAVVRLVKRLKERGIITQNEEAEYLDDEGVLSPQGKEMVKNLMLGAMFGEDTIRMMANEPALKNKAIQAMRAIMANAQLGEYSLRTEIDQAVQLIYEAKKAKKTVDEVLRTPAMFGENAADRYPSMVQLMALTLEGGVSDFRDLLNEYNRNVAARSTGEEDMFAPKPTKEELIQEYLKYKNWKDYATKTKQHQGAEGSNAVEGVQEPQQSAAGADGTGAAEQPQQVDNQGNPVNADGTLKVEKVKSLDEISDEDFTAPKRNVELPTLPGAVADAIGTNGKPVVIKKNILERNGKRHDDLSPTESRIILQSALYNPDIYGQSQPKKRPYNWVVINTKDEEGKNRTVLLEINENKDNVEIVHWHYMNEEGLEKIKRQAEREDGQLLILPSETSEEAGALSSPTLDKSSAGKGTENPDTKQGNSEKTSKPKTLAEVAEWVKEKRKRNPDCLFLVRHGDEYIAFDRDAETLKKVYSEAYAENDKLTRIKASQLDIVLPKLIRAGERVAIAENPSGKPRLQKAGVTPSEDAAYMEAVKRGDMETAQRMVNEAAKRNGYATGSDYQGTSAFNGAAPYGNGYFLTKQERKEAWESGDFEGESTLGDYIDNGVDGGNIEELTNAASYRAADEKRKEAIESVRDAVSSGSKTIRMYRSVPSSVKEGSFRNGDWVTPSRKYAEENARLHGWGENYHIIEQDVPVDEVWFDGNDIAEWGYGREEDYANDTDFAYKNTRNNRKLLAPVTYDNEGRVIPLSERFNEGQADERYHRGETTSRTPSPQERALRDAVSDMARKAGIEVIEDEAEGQRVLDMANDVQLSRGRNKKSANETALPGAEAPFKGTVVSSADGAKVLQKVDNLIKELENFSSAKQRTVVGDIAKAFGMERPATSSSQYATFETVNGETVTLRLSGHNAKQSGFDGAGRDNGISIVISRKSNEGITEDGNAHIVEYYYSDKALRQAEGHPLAEIVKSMKQVLYSGEYKDTTGLAERDEVPSEVVREMRVYHGSGADFEEFDLSYAGTGDGTASFGHGHYTSDSKGIGTYYAKAANGQSAVVRVRENGEWREVDKSNPDYEAAQTAGRLLIDRGSYKDAVAFADRWRDEAQNEGMRNQWQAAYDYLKAHKAKDIKAEDAHILYTVEIPDDNGSNYLDWFEPIGKETAERLYGTLVEPFFKRPLTIDALSVKTGGEFYKQLMAQLGNGQAANEQLAKLGYVGIKYQAGTNYGGAKEGELNHVIFNDADIKITDKVRFFKTSNGEAYGFTVGGKIYIDPRIATAETPVHEYAHLWGEALRKGNPKEWQNVVGLMKGTSVWEEVKERYPELKTDDEIADEVLATYSGRKGAERLRAEQHRIAQSDMSLTDKAAAIGALEGVKQALKKFWKAVADFLHIHYTSAEEVADRVLYDLLSGSPLPTSPRRGGERTAQGEATAPNGMGGVRMEAKRRGKSADAKQREEDNYYIDQAVAFVMGKTPQEARAERLRREEARRQEAKEIYDAVLRNDFNSVTLQRINNYIDDATPQNPHGRRISQRVPQKMERSLHAGERTNAVDALFSRICEMAVAPNGRTGAAARRAIEARKEESLEAWARATGHWHESVSDFTDSTKPIRSGTDSVVYPSNDGKTVIKVSKGKFDGRKFPSDIDQVNLFNYVFHNTAYRILGYGRNADGQFVRYLEQPFVDFGTSTPLTVEERVDFMQSLGYKPINKEKTTFSNGTIVVADLQKSNIVKSADGNIRVIDADVKLHTKDIGGKYTYPAVEEDTRQRFGEQIRYQFAGERGAREADRAEEVTTRMDNLGVAREMEAAKKDAKAIKLATGWERGADGKWRYEMPDVKMDKIIDRYKEQKAKIDELKAKLREPNQLIEDIDSKLRQLEFDVIWTEDDKKRNELRTQQDELYAQRDEAEKKTFPIWKQLTPLYKELHTPQTLESIIGKDHPVLKAYPQLRETEVEISESSLGHATYASVNADGKLIRLSGDYMLSPKMPPFLAHEVQHAIQHIEGFAKGGNEQMGERIAKNRDKLTVQQRKFVEDVKIWEDASQDPKMREQYPLSQYIKDNVRSGEYDADFAKDLVGMTDEELMREYNRLKQYERRLSGLEVYKRLGGEVESRNVEKRMAMTPEERRNSLASETEDVSREDQIFLFGEGGESAMALGDPADTFKERQKRAVEEKGVVMPGLNEAEVDVVDVPKHRYTGDIAQATDQAKKAAKAKYVPNGTPIVLHYDNHGQKFDYAISKDAIDESLNSRQQKKSVEKGGNKGAHLALAEHLDEVINNSIEVEEHPDYGKNDNGERDGSKWNEDSLMHRFYGAVEIDGTTYRVMTLMHEKNNAKDGNGVHAYEVQKIEVLNDETPSTPNDGGSTERGRSTYPVAKLLQNVEKSYDEGKKLLEKSENRSASPQSFAERHGLAASLVEDYASAMRNGNYPVAYNCRLDIGDALRDGRNPFAPETHKHINSVMAELDQAFGNIKDMRETYEARQKQNEEEAKAQREAARKEAEQRKEREHKDAVRSIHEQVAAISTDESNGNFNPRVGITPVRGAWTKDKVRKRLKEVVGTRTGYDFAARLIAEFDSPEELAAHMFYHGTVHGGGRLKPSVLMSDREIEQLGGGGYGDKYWGVSVSKSKKIASNFSGTSNNIRIYPMVLAKNARVIELPNAGDAADLDDYITDLWENGVDAVWIGDKNAGEQELCVINPKAIVNINRADSYAVYGLGTERNPLNIIDEQGIVKLYDDAKRYVEQKANAPRQPQKPSRYNADFTERKSDEQYAKDMAEYERKMEEYRNSQEYKDWEKAQREAADNIFFRTSDELTDEYGTRWLDEQTTDDGRHTTQVKNTINSYKKFGEWVKRDAGGRDVSVLDASSGFGLGTQWMRENGIKADDVEPYPSENREKPTFGSYAEINKKYDYIISNAVLNVIPDDWRANVLHDMADKMKVGGKMVINVRGAQSIREQGIEGKTKITLDDPSEILVLRPDGSIRAYQKGFTKPELKEWVESELGDGYTVEVANTKNAGGSYDTAVVVTKNERSSTTNDAAPRSGQPTRKGASIASSGAKVVNKPEAAKLLSDLSAEIDNGELGAHELLHEVTVALSGKEREGASTDKSEYYDLGGGVTLRVSDHQGNAKTFADRSEHTDNYGLVIKVSPRKATFKPKDGVDYLEYVYYPDKLTDSERQKSIVDGLAAFLNNGDYSSLPEPDRVNTSGKFHEVDLQRSGEGYNFGDGVEIPIMPNGKKPGKVSRSYDGSRYDVFYPYGKRYEDYRVDHGAFHGEFGSLHELEETAREQYPTMDVRVIGEEGDPTPVLSIKPWPQSEPRKYSARERREREAYGQRVRQQAIDKVKELAKKLHLDNVEIIEDKSTLEGKRATAKGFFNPRTGKITIVLDNHRSAADVVKTLLHEAVAHYGLRKLVGEENFNTFLDNVYKAAEERIRNDIDRMAEKLRLRDIERMARQKGGGIMAHAEAVTEAEKKREQYRRKATEEYMASLAEDTDFENAMQSGWWSKIKTLFSELFKRLGLKDFADLFHDTVTDNELRYILWRSYENLKGEFPSVFKKAEDVVMQDKLHVGNYSEEGRVKNEELRGGRVAEDIADANARFNEDLSGLTEQNADRVTLSLGRPSGTLLLGGVADLPMKLYGNKVIKKMKKHGFELSELQDLPKAVADPIAVFNNYQKDGKRSILTELQTANGNFLVTLNVGKGEDIDFNIVSSVFGKGDDNVVDWLERGLATYINKEKALNYLHHSALLAEALSSPRLVSAAKVVENFENPTEIPEKSLQDLQAEDDVLFRDGDPEDHERALARDEYERRVKTGWYQSREAMQDSMAGLEEGLRAILKAEGKKGSELYMENIADFENPYIGENRLSSQNQDEANEFKKHYFKPMLDEVKKLAKNADERAELTDYMMAKHGLERNEVMARRDADKEWEAYQKKTPNGQKTWDDFYNANRERDYAGLTALTGKDDVADAEAEARQMVQDYEAAFYTQQLWDAVNDTNAATLRKTYESGLISKATYDDISSMYQHYIPLRGFDEQTAEETYAYLNHRESVMNSPIKTAKGRKSKADDPFANMAAMAESAIMQGNRNTLIGQRMLNFALNHPSDLVSVSQLWLHYDPVKDEWKPVFPDNIEDTDTAAEVEQKLKDFETKMEGLRQQHPDDYKHGRDTVGIPYRVVSQRDKQQHQVVVKRGGMDYVLTVNGNPRMAQALNGQSNPDSDATSIAGKLLQLGQKAQRLRSKFATQRNPNFAGANFVRDQIYSNTMAWVKESPAYAARFNMNALRCNPATMGWLIDKDSRSALDMSSPLQRMYHEFMRNGGDTGFLALRGIDERKDEIREMLKDRSALLHPFALLGKCFDYINMCAENSARFAAYVTSRQMGRTVGRSIWDAKEASVNFNKKGAGEKFAGATGQTAVGNAAAYTSGAGRAFYMFWNAAVQGSFGNFFKNVKRHPVKAAGMVMLPQFALGFLMGAMGYGGDGDDDDNKYADLPLTKRRQNLCVKVGEQWVTIPLPVEFRVFYGLGELAATCAFSPDAMDDAEIAQQTAEQLTQTLPLDFMEGGGGLHAFLPSWIAPGVEMAQNKSWTGVPIYNDSQFNENLPEWRKAYKGANQQLVGAAKWLNEETGGDDATKGSVDLNPAQVEYLLNSYFSGYVLFVNQAIKTGETVSGSRDFEWRNIPMANRFLASADERTAGRSINNTYYNYLEKAKAMQSREREYKKIIEAATTDDAKRKEYTQKLTDLYQSDDFRRNVVIRQINEDVGEMGKEFKQTGDPTLEQKVTELKSLAVKIARGEVSVDDLQWSDPNQ